MDQQKLIRQATLKDAGIIRTLLEQLRYPTDPGFIEQQLPKMLAHSDHEILVCELERVVVAFMSIHFVPQIALAGDFAIVSYLCVDEAVRGKGIGTEMNKYAEWIARKRGCDRIQLHSSIWRTEAHQFYLAQGYEEYPLYFSKAL